MSLQKEVRLNQGSSLQILYPRGWNGEKSGLDEDLQFYISTKPKLLTVDEIAYTESYLKSVFTNQKLVFTGMVLIDPEDPLKDATHEELDKLETEKELPSTNSAASGGKLPILTRVLRIRENGYEGGKFLSLSSSK